MSEAIKPGLPEGFTGGAIRAGEPIAVPGEVRPRVWPAVILVALQWAALIVPMKLAPGESYAMYGFMFSITVGVLGFLIWWVFGSRVRWSDVGIGLLTMALGVGAICVAGHPTMRDFMPIMGYVEPMMAAAVVIWLGLTPFLSWRVRRAGMLVAILAVCGYYTTVRVKGMDGIFKATFQPRWRLTDEENFLANRAAKGEIAAEPLVAREGDWPEFRGAARDSIRRDVAIETDWNAHPPKLLWKQLVGPGWSSFAVIGDRLFTQEQRGPSEAVVCYDAATGKEIWEHSDSARFDETIGGPGPRATPTFHVGKLYTQGAAGKLNCLDARTGAVIWSRDIGVDSGSNTPIWGFAASPLVMDGIVTVYGGEKEGKAVLAYDADTGEPKWQQGHAEQSYCSTQAARIDGVDQILFVSSAGLISLEPKKGKVLWNHEWPDNMARCTQPNVIGSDILFGTGFDKGTRRIHVEHTGDTWNAKETWTSRSLRPYYNDFVVHDGFIYGFDGPFFTCLDLKDGKKKWRERGYGNGQVLLLPKQNLLLILSEGGDGDGEFSEIALVEATPTGHKELAKIPALNGKTWNHPVVANGRLFIRNGREMACFELTPMSLNAQGK